MAEWIGSAIEGLPDWAILLTAISAGLIVCAWFVFSNWPSGKKGKK